MNKKLSIASALAIAAAAALVIMQFLITSCSDSGFGVDPTKLGICTPFPLESKDIVVKDPVIRELTDEEVEVWRALKDCMKAQYGVTCSTEFPEVWEGEVVKCGPVPGARACTADQGFRVAWPKDATLEEKIHEMIHSILWQCDCDPDFLHSGPWWLNSCGEFFVICPSCQSALKPIDVKPEDTVVIRAGEVDYPGW